MFRKRFRVTRGVKSARLAITADSRYVLHVNGERVFDIKLQGKTVAGDFDILKEAGGPNRAVVRDLTLELAPPREIASKDATKAKREAPILCFIELVRE